jgi:hypothetical protein
MPDSGLKKLTIRYESSTPGTYDQSVEAMFNPEQLTFESAVTWEPIKPAASGKQSRFLEQRFRSANPRTLRLDLYFNTYEGKPGPIDRATQRLAGLLDPTASGWGLAPKAVSVRTYTEQVSNLAGIAKELHRPPVCQLSWGEQTLLLGVLTSCTESWTMFMPDGTPVRAKLQCTFSEYRTNEVEVRRSNLQSADLIKTFVVQRGANLASIAYREYGDPKLWRIIARANQIIDPLGDVTPGMVLTIPPLTKQSRGGS